MIRTIRIFTYKNAYAFFIKLLATSKQLIRRNSICCLKNQAIFHRVSIEIGLTSPLPLFILICSLRTPSPLHNKPRVSHRFWGHGRSGSSKFDGDGFKSIHGGRLKILLKNSCGGVHLIVKLPAISLQACKFTKNELLHSYFWRILARF